MRHLPACLALTLLSSACSGLEAEAMIPEKIQVGDPHPGIVRVDAIGSKPVGGEQLARAVGAAITAAHLFESVAEPGAETCDWVLTVHVKDLERDSPDLYMTTEATFDWSLGAGAEAKPSWSETIVTSFRATPDDTGFVEERGRIATTRAVQENIRRALASLGELELD